MKRRFSILVMVSMLAAAFAHAEQTPADEANGLYQAGKWKEAAAAYAAIVAADPTNRQAWYRLGVSRLSSGDASESIDAFTRAEALGAPVGYVRYNLAAAYARLDRTDEAFASLLQAVKAGFTDTHQLSTDEDLASLRQDARWNDLIKTAEAVAHPCRNDSRFRQLHFWVGEWDVRDTASSTPVGTSRVESIIDDCVVLENWTGARGGQGKSFNVIDPATGKWKQIWTDSTPQTYEFIGEPGENRMVYSRVGTVAGQPTRIRMTLSRLPTGEVRQLSEQSTDDGKTWHVGYDFTYAPAKK